MKTFLSVLLLPLFIVFFTTSLHATEKDKKLSELIPLTKNVAFLHSFIVGHVSKTDSAITVTGKLATKTATITKYLTGTKGIEVTSKDLKLGDIFKDLNSIPALNALAFDKLDLFDDYMEVEIELNGQSVSLIKEFKHSYSALFFKTLNASTFIPAAKGHMVNSMELDNALFIIKGDSSSSTQTITAKELPGDLPKRVGWSSSETMDILSGVNIAATFNVKKSKAFSDALKLVGIKSKTLPIRGTLSKDTFKFLSLSKGKKGSQSSSSSISKKDKKSILSGLSLHINTPMPNIPHLKDLLNISGLPKLSIGGGSSSSTNSKNNSTDSSTSSSSSSSQGLHISLDFDAKLTGLKLPEVMKVRIDMNPPNNAPLALIISKATSWKAPFGIKDLTIKNGSFKFLVDDSAKASKRGEAKKSGLNFSGIASFAKQKNIDINAEFLKTSKGIKLKQFELDGNFKLSSLIPSSTSIKALSKFKFTSIVLEEEALTIDGTLSNKPLSFKKYFGKNKKTEVTSKDLKLGDIFKDLKSISVLNDLGFDKLELSSDFMEVEIELNGQSVSLIKEFKHSYSALFFKTLNASTFIPAAKGHMINDMELDNALFIIKGDSSSSTQTITAKELPGDLPKRVGWSSSETMDILSGVNIAATFNVKKSKAFSDALKLVGINTKTLPIRGTLSKDTFKFLAKSKAKKGSKSSSESLSKSDKKSLLSGLSLHLNTPIPKIPGFKKLLHISGSPKLSIGGGSSSSKDSSTNTTKGNAKSTSQGVTISLDFTAKLSGLKIPEAMNVNINLNPPNNAPLAMIISKATSWKAPFGIKDLTIKNGNFKFLVDDSAKAKDLGIGFSGIADFSKHKSLSLSAEIFKTKNGFSLKYFKLDGKLKLSSIPGGDKIPHAKQFELDEIKITPTGIEAKTVFNGKKVDAFLFEIAPGSGWTFVIEQKDFTLTELLPSAENNKVLKQITLPKAALIISEKGVQNSRSNLPLIAKDMFDDIFGKSNIDIKIASGIAIVADFDPKSMGIIGTGLSKIGVHDDAILMGEFTGVFQGSPGFMLALQMEKAGNTSGLPKKVMTFPKNVVPQFFLQWSGEDIDVGVDIGLSVKAGKDTLFIDSKIELQFDEKGFGVDILGEMDGTWHKPFGLPAIALSDLKMKVGINDVGEVTIGFAGKDTIGKEEIDLAVEMNILLEDALPDGVAFSGKISNLGIPALIDIAETLMQAPNKLSNIPMPYFEIHDAMIAFATPGATDPQLGLVSEGFAFAGSFFFMSRELGSIKGSGGKKGITFDGDIADIDLDILSFKNNNLDIAINLKPKFIMNSDIKLLGAVQKIEVDLAPPHFEFEVIEDMGHFGNADLRVRLDGFDLTKGTFDKNADISIVGEFQSSLVPWLSKEITKGLDELKTSADKKLDDDKKELNDAQAKVDKINKKIQKLRAKDDKAKQRAEAKLDKAKKRVSHLKGKYNHAKHKAKHCGSKWTHWACSGYWKTEAAAIYISYEIAEGVLDAVKKIVAAAYDLDPAVAALIVERDAATTALSIAKAVVEVSLKAEDFVLDKLEALLKDALKDLPFEIDQAIIIGDLKDMLKKKNPDPLVLDMKFKMFGDPMREYFAIKLKDPIFDAASFALLPAIAMDKLTESALKKVDPSIAKWIHSHIAVKLAEAEENVRKAVEDEEAKYKDILTSYENGSKKFKKAYSDLNDEHTQIVSAFKMSDLMGDSKEFKNTYLAVGHSSLCLGVALNGIDVFQENCKDIATERWSTKALDDGYVQLKSNGLCLKAKNADDKNGQPLMLSECDSKDIHEQWKIISTDGFYDKIVNKFSQKCLHFHTENANPKTAYAVWTSCVGADSQTFRDIADAERPTWHPVNDTVKANNGICLSTKNSFDTYFKKEMHFGHLTISKEKHTLMKHKGDDLLISTACKSDDEERFSYTEMVDGDIRLVHAKSGWCVVPKHHNNQHGLILAPCDKGKDMLWRNKRETNSSFEMYNNYARECITLNKTTKNSSPAITSRCIKSSAQSIKFVK